MSSEAQLTEQGVPTLHEASHRKGLMQGIALLVGSSFAGPAQTVEIPAGDNLGIHMALQQAPPGTVLCVASGGRGLYGVAGELIVEAARVRRLAALVVDDGVRDIERLIAPPAIAARGVSARGTTKRRVVSMGEAVAVGGVLIRPGDWVVGDSNGVCVLPADRLEEIVAAARTRAGREDDLREKIRQGMPTTKALGLAPED